MSDPVTVTVTLRPTRPDTDVSRAIRWLLKRLLRQWGLRCVRVSWGEAGEGRYTVSPPSKPVGDPRPVGVHPIRHTLSDTDGDPSVEAGLNGSSLAPGAHGAKQAGIQSDSGGEKVG